MPGQLKKAKADALELKKQRLLELKQKKLEVLRAKAQYQKDNLIEFFNADDKPLMDGTFLRANNKQQLLLDAFKNPRYRIFTYTGANRCLGGAVEIYDPIKDCSTPISEIKDSFHVLAWDGEKLVPAFAHKPFMMEKDQLYEVNLASGHSFVASGEHQILTPSGYRTVSELRQGCAVFHPGSSLEPCPSTRAVDGQSSLRKAQDFLSGCPTCSHLCGEPLPPGQDTAQAVAPSQGGAQEHTCPCPSSQTDGRVHTGEYSHQHLSGDHPSTQGDPLRYGGRFAASGCHVSYTASLRLGLHTQADPLPTAGSFPQPQPIDGFAQPANRETLARQSGFSCTQPKPSACHSQVEPQPNGENVRLPQSIGEADPCPNSPSLPCETFTLNSCTLVSSIHESAYENKWDLHVPFYNNYYAQGAIHHNCGKTTIWAIIAVCLLAGKWLWNGEPIRFPHNKPRKLRVIGQGWSSHIKTVVVPELWKWWPKNRPLAGGRPKKNNDGVEYFWEDELTGSTLEIMSNKQEPEMFEGWSGDGIFFDEPPRRDIRIASARGLIDRGGFEMYAATLLKEAWVDQEVLKARLPDGRPDPTVFNVHATIEDNIGFGITRENVEQFAKMLRPEEADARLKGIPSYMSGLVYPRFKRDLHLKKRFKVPLDWPVDISIDTHPRKPHSVMFMATAPNRYKYGIHEIRQAGDGKQLAEAIVRILNWGTYRVNRVIIDPLSKGDPNNIEGTTFQKAAEVFARYDILLETASKNKDAGILQVKDYLMGPNNEPSLFFFDDLIFTIKEIEGLMWEKAELDDKERASKIDDDFMECLYRLILLNTVYTEPDEYDDIQYAPVSANPVTGY